MKHQLIEDMVKARNEAIEKTRELTEKIITCLLQDPNLAQNVVTVNWAKLNKIYGIDDWKTAGKVVSELRIRATEL